MICSLKLCLALSPIPAMKPDSAEDAIEITTSATENNTKPKKQLKIYPTFDGGVHLRGAFVAALMTDEDLFNLCCSLSQSDRTILQSAYFLSLGEQE